MAFITLELWCSTKLSFRHKCINYRTFFLHDKITRRMCKPFGVIVEIKIKLSIGFIGEFVQL